MSTETVEYIDTKTTAALMRKALRAAWPAVKFSVKMDRGTGYGWLSVSWEDGPTEQAVKVLASVYEGSRFDGMDDSYHEQPRPLVSFRADEMPREVRFSCCGVSLNRRMGTEGTAWAIEQLCAGGIVAQLKNEQPSWDVYPDQETVEALFDALNIYTPNYGAVTEGEAAHRLHWHHDFTA